MKLGLIIGLSVFILCNLANMSLVTSTVRGGVVFLFVWIIAEVLRNFYSHFISSPQNASQVSAPQVPQNEKR